MPKGTFAALQCEKMIWSNFPIHLPLSPCGPIRTSQRVLLILLPTTDWPEWAISSRFSLPPSLSQSSVSCFSKLRHTSPLSSILSVSRVENKSLQMPHKGTAGSTEQLCTRNPGSSEAGDCAWETLKFKVCYFPQASIHGVPWYPIFPSIYQNFHLESVFRTGIDFYREVIKRFFLSEMQVSFLLAENKSE